MKKDFKLSTGLLTVVTLSSVVLASEATMSTVQAHTPTTAVTVAQANGNFQFIATVVDAKGNNLAGKIVVVSDVTDGASKVLQTLTTDAKGQAIFSALPTNRNISVSVDGVVKGYTLRTSEANTTKVASFTAEGVGQGTPTYSTSPLDVFVRNQDAEAIAGKSVTLKDAQGNDIETIVSNAEGLARFSQKLMDGTFYQIYVDGKKLAENMPGHYSTVYLDQSSSEHKHDDKKDSSTKSDPSTGQKSEEGFTFVATVMNKEGKALEGKEVALFDITDGKALALTSVKTNASGQAIFKKLPLSRNISVKVDGEDKGYTLRTSENGAEKAVAFYAKGEGQKAVPTTKTPLTVTVRDADGQGLPNQKVTLKNELGQVMAEMMTDKDGKVTVTDKLMDGMFYSLLVNDVKMRDLTPGNDVSVYLKADQIKKATDKDASDMTKSDKNSTKSADKTSDKVDNAKKSLDPVKQDSKTLPKAGDKAVTILSLVGVVMLGLASLLLIAKKKMN
ncbi:LPXTG cell wall anchor domain-containing protein [Streptococcus ictaluri]|uniref:Gram positive anchor n=1 Tax=Streptococcus ictaluri 707-05 TaxID=764299 RepID=G5K3M9_9STRE|nr:LPXTG cell wall anchor domain-containing protein [Streptococcus ictaluri]EHI69633.1 gram positive anchor [Streptococcus ictaluri 707-05]